MPSASRAPQAAIAKGVRVTAQSLVVDLQGGRTVSVPLGWYPRLAEGTPGERRRWELIGPGTGIHWPELDEDISVDSLLKGIGSNESPASLQRWRALRRQPKKARRPLSRGQRKVNSPRASRGARH